MRRNSRTRNVVTASLVLGQQIGQLLVPLLGITAITAGGLLLFFSMVTVLLSAL